MAANKDEFLAEMKNQYDDLNYRWSRERDKIEARLQHEGEDARKEYEAKRDEFRQFRDEVKGKIDGLETAGENAWKDLKDGTENAWNMLTKAFDKATSHFKP
jgi:hypothetical protein